MSRFGCPFSTVTLTIISEVIGPADKLSIPPRPPPFPGLKPIEILTYKCVTLPKYEFNMLFKFLPLSIIVQYTLQALFKTHVSNLSTWPFSGQIVTGVMIRLMIKLILVDIYIKNTNITLKMCIHVVYKHYTCSCFQTHAHWFVNDNFTTQVETWK